MSLDQAYFICSAPTARESNEQQRALRSAVGRGQRCRATILPHRTAVEQAGRRRGCQLLIARTTNYPGANAFGAAVPIGAFIKRLSPPVSREHTRRGGHKGRKRHELEAHCECKRKHGLATTNCLPTAMQRNKA